MASEGEKSRTQMLAAMLRDPDYWDSFMGRAREPIFKGGPTLGAMVPGLGSYMSTTDSLKAFDRGDYRQSAAHAASAGAQVMPGDAAQWLRLMTRIPALLPPEGGK